MFENEANSASANELASLRKAVKSLEERLSLMTTDLTYRIDTIAARDAWQTVEEQNVDSVVSCLFDVYLPPNSVVRHIQRVYLRVKLLPLRYYSVTTGAMATGATATGCTIVINGTDRTTALVGAASFSTDQTELDITKYMTATGYNTISITSTGLGRIRATIFTNVYLNTR